MGGMSSPNTQGYAPSQFAPTAGGKGPTGSPQYLPQRSLPQYAPRQPYYGPGGYGTGQPASGAQLMGGTVTPQADMGQPVAPQPHWGAEQGSPSFNQFTQQQNLQPGSQLMGSTVTPQTSFGGGYTGGGMSRSKGFKSGGHVSGLHKDDIDRILKALDTAREVVKDGK